MRTRSILTIGLAGLLCAMSVAAHADDAAIRAALERWKHGEQAAAQKAMQALADGGDARAQALSGAFLHYTSDGKADKDALALWQKAADAGDAEGQYRVGWAYSHGYAVTADPFAAGPWYEKAAAQGHLLAQYNLALQKKGKERTELLKEADAHGLSLAGLQLAPDYPPEGASAAVRQAWLDSTVALIKRGEADAMRWLGVYYKSKGPDQDPDKAEAAFRTLAAMDPLALARDLPLDTLKGMGLPEDRLKFQRNAVLLAQFNLASILENKGGEKSLAEARRWYLASAEGGNAIAQGYLSTRYALGLTFDVDPYESYRWAVKASEQGLALGWTMRGNGELLRDDPAAEASFLKAIDMGEPLAGAQLGWALAHGQLGPRDEAKGRKHLLWAAEQGEVHACHYLGSLMLDAVQLKRDPKEGERWLKKAAELGDASAALELGRRRLYALGLPQSTAEALKWVDQAMTMGDPNAHMMMAVLAAKMGGDKNEAYALDELGIAAAHGQLDARGVLAQSEDKAQGQDAARRLASLTELKRMAKDGDLGEADLGGRLGKEYVYKFSGLIDGRYPVVLGMDVAEDGRVKGAYYYRRSQGKPLTLSGSLKNGQFEAEERDGTGNVTGTFEGAFGLDRLRGRWTGTNGKARPFELLLKP